MSFFSIFHTSRYTFDGKKDYEVVLILLYRHWWTLFVDLLMFVMLFFLPFVIEWFIGGALISWGADSAFHFLLSVYFLVWWSSIFYRITMYLLDTWIVTDHRILDNEQHGFFNRTVAELSLHTIQDISVSVSGLIPTFFDYGDVEIQTAGTLPKFVFKQVPHPNHVRDIIMKAHSDYMATHPNDIETHDHPPAPPHQP